MIRAIAAAAVLLAASPAAAVERNFAVAGFDRISVEGSAEVMVTTGRGASVHASGDPVALDHLNIRVENGMLKIGGRRNGFDLDWGGHGQAHVAVSVPSLREVGVAGSAGVVVDRVKADTFAAAIVGSGSLRIDAVDAERVTLAVDGSGSATVAGRCGEGTARIRGSGEMKLAELKCATLSASVAGSGSMNVFASKTATLATMGSGDITLAGGARCTVSTAGSGRVNCS